jgi:dolichol kinase
MPLSTELRRKLFHHLPLLYMAIYALFPGWFAISLLGVALAAESVVEFIRLRRPKVNDWFLNAFGGLHRPSEILAPSGLFWTLAGSWIIMVLLEEKTLVIPILGMLVFGDTAAALYGRRAGVHFWPSKPVEEDKSLWAPFKLWKIPADSTKTYEGSAAFALASFLWISLFLRPHVALIGAAAGAWVESRKQDWNDNFWIPVGGGIILGVISLVLAGGVGRPLHLWQKVGIPLYIVGAFTFYAFYDKPKASG